MPRLLAVVLIYVMIVVGILALSYLILPSFLSDVADFMKTLPNYITTLNVKSKSTVGSDFFGWQTAIQGLSNSESLGDAVRNITTSLSTTTGSVLATFTAIFGGVTSFVLIIVLSFYMSVREHGIEEFLRIVAPIKHEAYVIGLWKRTQHKIGRWIQGQFILALIVGVLVFIGLSLLHVKHAFLFALISTVFEIIPIFGPFIGSVPGVLAAFVQGGLTFGVIIALMYLIIQQIESNVIYPLVVQKVLDIHPLIVIIALIVGLKLGGVLGVLLSVPLAAALMEYLTDISEGKRAMREKFSVSAE